MICTFLNKNYEFQNKIKTKNTKLDYNMLSGTSMHLPLPKAAKC